MAGKADKKTYKKRKIHPVLVVFLALVAALVLSCVLSLILSRWGLTTSHYEVTSEKLTGSFRVVSLADIHGTVFGKDNRRLIKRVAAEKPDLILIPGDLINKNDADTSDEERLIEALVKIAQVYVSPGNHETEYDSEHGLSGETSVLERYVRAGAVVLNKSYVDIEVRGQAIRLGGQHGYCVPEGIASGWMLLEHPYLKEFEDTDRFSILMNHMPYSFLTKQGLEKWKFDTVISGHVHGGQIRFPFFGKLSKYKFGQEDLEFPYWGGFSAPDQEHFPGRLAGVYTSKDGKRTMVLSRGLGSTEKIPRFNNIPEVVVIDYGPRKQ